MLSGVKSQINSNGRWYLLAEMHSSFPGAGRGILLSHFLCPLGLLADLRVSSQTRKALAPKLPCRVDSGSRGGPSPVVD